MRIRKTIEGPTIDLWIGQQLMATAKATGGP